MKVFRSGISRSRNLQKVEAGSTFIVGVNQERMRWNDVISSGEFRSEALSKVGA